MINKASQEFLDWLDNCPCEWFLNKYDEDEDNVYLEYGFKDKKRAE